MNNDSDKIRNNITLPSSSLATSENAVFTLSSTPSHLERYFVNSNFLFTSRVNALNKQHSSIHNHSHNHSISDNIHTLNETGHDKTWTLQQQSLIHLPVDSFLTNSNLNHPTNPSIKDFSNNYYDQDFEENVNSSVTVRLPLKISQKQFKDRNINYTTIEVGKSHTETKSITNLAGDNIYSLSPEIQNHIYSNDNEEENDKELEDIWADRKDDIPPIMQITNKLGDLKTSDLRNCFNNQEIKQPNAEEKTRSDTPRISYVKEKEHMWCGHVFYWNQANLAPSIENVENGRAENDLMETNIDSSKDIHSRLFPLLQLNTKNVHRKDLEESVTMDPNSKEIITKAMIDELVNSLLQSSNGHYLRNVPREMIQTAAQKALEEEHSNFKTYKSY